MAIRLPFCYIFHGNPSCLSKCHWGDRDRVIINLIVTNHRKLKNRWERWLIKLKSVENKK